MVVVGAGGGGLNAAARAAELGADVICVEALGLHGGNAQSAGMCGILGGMSMQEKKKFAFPSYPFDAQALTDWAMDEYHYAADPKLIYKIASEGGKSLDWMADCGVQWRLGEVPVYVAPKNATLDHHVLKMKDATDAMFMYGQRKRRALSLPVSLRRRARARRHGRIVGLVANEEFDHEVYIHARRPSSSQRAASATTRPCSSATFHGCHGLCVELSGRRRNRRVLPHGSRRRRRRVGIQQLGELRRRRGLARPKAGSGRASLRRHDPALPPAVADHRSLRQPPALYGLPRGRGRRERHLRLGDLATIQMTPRGIVPTSSSTRTTRIIWRASRRSIAASSSRPTSSRSRRCPSITATGTTACRTPSTPTC